MILLTAYQYHERKAQVADNGINGGTIASVPRPGLTVDKSSAGQPVGPEGSRLSTALHLEPSVIPAVPQVADKQRELKERAIGLFNKKDYEGALTLFRKIEHTDTVVLLGMGVCYFKTGDYQDSVSFLKRVLDSDENNFMALKVIAFAYYKIEDVEEGFINAGKGLSVKKDAELEALYKRLDRERKAREGYTEESSSHFRILFDGYEHGSVEREILDLLEDAYRQVGQQLDYFPPEPITVILYTDRNFYDTTQAPHWSRGVYDGKIRLPVRGAGLQIPVMKKVLFHEYAHVLVHCLAHSCPTWINEGLAEYFSASYRRRTGQVIPLRNIDKSFSALTGGNVGLAYWESYSAVSYLIDKYGFYRIKELLRAFGEGNGADEAFEKALGVTYSDFISNWGKDQ